MADTNLTGLKQKEQEELIDTAVGHEFFRLREHNGHFVYRVTGKLKDGYAIKDQKSGSVWKLLPKDYGNFVLLH